MAVTAFRFRAIQSGEINGVSNQHLNEKLYEWMWYIDGNIGALSP